MKRILWLLVCLNVLVLAYFKLFDLSSAQSTLKSELHPEQMKLLDAQSLNDYPPRATAEPATESMNALAEKPVQSTPIEVDSAKSESSKIETAPPVQATPTPEVRMPEPHAKLSHACYEWGSFNLAKINEAVDTAKQLGIKHVVNQQSGAIENARYWIYKPPLATAEAAQTKAEELRKLGVEDFFIVQDPKWRNAISFGVFRDEQLADKLMADLKAKGVRLLIKSTRFGGQGQAIVKLEAVTPQQFASLKTTQPQFPDSVLKEIPCQ